MDKKCLKIAELAALLALCAALCVGTWAQGRQEALSGKLLRLHVLAHSDAAAEQRIKLRVRDAVLEYVEPLLEEAAGLSQAEGLIAAHMEEIAAAAFSASQGRQVTVSLSTENYPTRRYDGFALPAGAYRSLKVELGEGAGENWWCVVFPPLCTQAVTAQEAYPVLSSRELELISDAEGRCFAFRSVELYGALKAWLSEQR